MPSRPYPQLQAGFAVASGPPDPHGGGPPVVVGGGASRASGHHYSKVFRQQGGSGPADAVGAYHTEAVRPGQQESSRPLRVEGVQPDLQRLTRDTHRVRLDLDKN